MRVKNSRPEGTGTIWSEPCSNETARTKKNVYWVREDLKSKTGSGRQTQWILRCRCDLSEAGEERWLMYW